MRAAGNAVADGGEAPASRHARPMPTLNIPLASSFFIWFSSESTSPSLSFLCVAVVSNGTHGLHFRHSWKYERCGLGSPVSEV